MHDVALAFLWHQHQPYYPDDVGGENLMPWVRLHGTKDYWGMAKLLSEVPELHATINLVPSLLKQLLAYTDSGHEDSHLRISRLPADGLSEEDMHYLLDNFFMVHPAQGIRPHRRYYDLYKKRGISIDSAARARKRFNKKDIIDLQCWSNLVWIHPLAFEQDPELAEFRKKGKHWTEKEKQWLLDKQMELLAAVVPLHRELQQRGQVELTTSPYYHPILPLLWDKRLARRAMPDVMLPKHLGGYAEDVGEQVGRGGIPQENLRPEAAGDVALGGLRLPGGHPGHRRGGHPLDRHRRGDPFLLDRRLGFPRWKRIPAQSGDALPAMAGRRAGRAVADRLPRPRHERPDRVPLPALPDEPRGG